MLSSALPTPTPLALDTIGTPGLWAVTIAAVVVLLVVDFVVTRRPHEVSMKEAVAWSAFYVALPLAFGGYVWSQHGSERGVEYYTGYVVEKALSVDNLFVFMLLLAAFAVPAALQQRVLLYGIVGALLMRGAFIALGAAALSAFDWVFLVFGLVLLATGVKLLRDALRGQDHQVDVSQLRVVRLARRLMPVTDEYDGPRMTVLRGGRRALTPLALVVVAVLATDLVFAIDSVPAVYGITGDPYLVFATNAFALLGLRALYFVLQGALARLVHLGFGLAAILGFIGVKLALHWAHLTWPAVPDIPTLASLAVILAILVVTTLTSLAASRPVADPAGRH
ncbi:TerC/Alx family metal homeostasis membrane protein [Nocardioides lijunqiniae]|uniref:TerC/Alx family metal homeostasis membrane protein n=1 Tax=Nocardioides lijunqiniae TaxID=2760832 RepID=UPI001878F48D|nr:TerC/Alx family metal homeostasis membrane protein [Nocardioides lijunqiniae]